MLLSKITFTHRRPSSSKRTQEIHFRLALAFLNEHLGVDGPIEQGRRQIFQYVIGTKVIALLDQFERDDADGPTQRCTRCYLAERKILIAVAPPATARKFRIQRPNQVVKTHRLPENADAAPQKALASAKFTGHQFHTLRKTVSMQVPYYDTMKSLETNDHAYRMSRFLAASHARMGSRHDGRVAESLSGRLDYGTPAPLAKETRFRPRRAVARYPF